MSWSANPPNANSARFKLKRSHSPDSVGVNNYKKQRLIQDFEKLSLKDGPDEIGRGDDSGGLIDAPDFDVVSLPNGIKKQIWKLRSGSNDYGDFNDEKLIYEKVIRAVHDERLQMIRWYDPLQIAYWQWVKWIEAIRWSFPAYHHNSCHDYDNYDGSYNIFDCDSDVDMDT